MIVLAVINKVNDFTVSRDSRVKYKLIFSSTLSLASPSWFRKLPSVIKHMLANSKLI